MSDILQLVLLHFTIKLLFDMARRLIWSTGTSCSVLNKPNMPFFFSGPLGMDYSQGMKVEQHNHINHRNKTQCWTQSNIRVLGEFYSSLMISEVE